MSELIITNGDSAAALLKAARIGDAWLPWRDVLHEGPVPETAELSALSQIRADFISGIGWSGPDTRQAFIDRDAQLACNEDHDNVTLWFEHDLYDQLQLLQILDWFADNWRDDGRVFLVQADDYLGMQKPDEIGKFAAHKIPVSGLQLGLSRVAWTAFRQPTPEAWAALLSEDLSALPFLKAAAVRMLEELPGSADGLTRVERETLKLIDVGTHRPARLFGAYAKTEDAMFLGDLSFYAMLDRLAGCDKPLISGLSDAPYRGEMDKTERDAYLQSTLRLTAFGQDVLEGGDDALAPNGIDRCWGGTHLTTASLWRWDHDTKQLVNP